MPWRYTGTNEQRDWYRKVTTSITSQRKQMNSWNVVMLILFLHKSGDQVIFKTGLFVDCIDLSIQVVQTTSWRNPNFFMKYNAVDREKYLGCIRG